MDQHTLPPALPSTIPAKKGLSTGCIISIVIAVIFVPTIFVIAVLAALVVPVLAVPAGNSAMSKARLLQARAASQGLIIAIKGFQTEYNQLPLPKGYAAAESTIIPSSGTLLDALLAEDSDINPRKIKFFEFPVAKNSRYGLLEKDGKRTLVDPWGQPYYILLDLDDDGKIFDLEHPGVMLDTTVGVFSAGPDGDPTTWQDNVKSWD